VQLLTRWTRWEAPAPPASVLKLTLPRSLVALLLTLLLVEVAVMVVEVVAVAAPLPQL